MLALLSSPLRQFAIGVKTFFFFTTLILSWMVHYYQPLCTLPQRVTLSNMTLSSILGIPFISSKVYPSSLNGVSFLMQNVFGFTLTSCHSNQPIFEKHISPCKKPSISYTGIIQAGDWVYSLEIRQSLSHRQWLV